MPSGNVTEGRSRASTSPEPPPLSVARWHALRLASRQDFAVRDRVRSLDLATFCPTVTVETAWSDRIVRAERPLFAGYLFVRCPEARQAEILELRGVVHFLSLDQRPCTISAGVIEDLRRVCESNAPVSLCPYVAGDAVRVETGPFAGVEGIVSRVAGNRVLSIPVEILGRSVQVRIDAADVQPA